MTTSICEGIVIYSLRFHRQRNIQSNCSEIIHGDSFEGNKISEAIQRKTSVLGKSGQSMTLGLSKSCHNVISSHWKLGKIPSALDVPDCCSVCPSIIFYNFSIQQGPILVSAFKSIYKFCKHASFALTSDIFLLIVIMFCQTSWGNFNSR